MRRAPWIAWLAASVAASACEGFGGALVGDLPGVKYTLAADGSISITGSQVRSWQVQNGLQPSHISKIVRKASDIRLTSGTDGTLTLAAAIALSAPKQAGQAEVKLDYGINVELKPGGERVELRDERSSPPWRRNEWFLHGSWLTGTATVREGERTLSVQAYASEQGASVPGGGWYLGGDAAITMAPHAGGWRLRAELPNVPTDASESANVTWLWPEPKLLAAANALEVTYRASTAVPQARLGVSIVNLPGTWFGSAAGLPIRAGERTALIPLRGLAHQGGRTEDYACDLSSVGGLRLSLSSGYGVGPVEVEIVRVAAVAVQTAAQLNEPAWPVTITADWQAELRTNGSSTISEGLFGVHAVGKAKDEQIAAALADSGIRSLRWLEHSGHSPVTGINRSEMDGLAAACGGSTSAFVLDTFTGSLFDPPPWGTWEPTVDKLAERFRAFYGSVAAQGWSNDHPERSLRRIEVWNEPFMWARHFNKPIGPATAKAPALQGRELWRDPQQHGYLPMQGIAEVYATLFNAAAEGAAAANPQVQLGGPSSASLGADDWRHLTGFVMPIVEACGERFAFLAEHHYQGRGQQYAAEFEVFQAFCLARVGRRIPIWNTECNDQPDMPGGTDPAAIAARAAGNRRLAAYQVAEISSHLRFGNDHTLGRAVHALWGGQLREAGERSAFALLKHLHGRLVPVTCGDDTHDGRIWAVACRHEANNTGALLIYNDAPKPRTVKLGSLPSVQRIITLDAGELREQPMEGTPASSQNVHDAYMQTTVPGLGAVLIVVGNLPEQTATLHRSIAYAQREGDKSNEGGLWWNEPGSRLNMKLHTARPGSSGTVQTLRLVAEGLGSGEATVQIGELSVPLPQTDLAPLHIIAMPLPQAVPWSDGMELTIITAATADGWRLCSLGAEIVEAARE